MSSSSNTGVSFSDARFLDDVSINSLPFGLKAETDGILKLFVNNPAENDVPDFSADKLEMASEFTINDNDTRKYNRYDIHRRIYLENAQREIDYHVLYNMNYQPYFDGMDFYNFLKYKGVK